MPKSFKPQELYGLRRIVLQECEDGNFYQVALTPAQFKDMINCTSTKTESHVELKEGYEMRNTNMKGTPLDADLFLGMEDWYE